MIPEHGARQINAVEVETYNAELRDSEGFLGDRASGRAFRAILQDGREQAWQDDDDPIGPEPSADIKHTTLDQVILHGDPEAAGVVLGTIEDFAQEFARVIRRFLHLEGWRETREIVVGGGLRASRVGELAIGRAAVLLKATGHKLALRPIRHHPDEAGLIGCAHLAPSAALAGHDAILAVDIGGSKIRAGIVALNQTEAADLSRAAVADMRLWQHAGEHPDRAEAVGRLGSMLNDLIAAAHTRGLRLAPFVGIGCPGLIRGDGSIAKGGQNLPGDWERNDFNLPNLLHDAIPPIDGQKLLIVMHNDAVVQGLSEAPFMRDVPRWGVMTIGTGLGNACFTSRTEDQA